MTINRDRFAMWREDFIFTPAESDEERFAAFAEPFGALGADGIFHNRGGQPLKIAPCWTEGLDRYAAFELARAARAIADPDEIRGLWKRVAGERIWTCRYLRTEGGVDIGVDINRAGWCFATSEDPCFELEELRVGEVWWARRATKD